MNSIDHIKRSIESLYKSDPNIHISINRLHPRLNVEKSPAKIVGVYKNIFQVEAREGVKLPVRTFQYGEVLIGQVSIEELNYTPIVSTSKKK